MAELALILAVFALLWAAPDDTWSSKRFSSLPLSRLWILLFVAGIVVLLAVASLLHWSELEYGTVPDWLSAIGTVGAFATALVLLRHGQREQREARLQGRRSQASQVSVTFKYDTEVSRTEDTMIEKYSGGVVMMRNGSDQPIFNVVVRIVATLGQSLATLACPVVAAGQDESRPLPPQTLPYTPSLAAIYSFVDNAGVQWSRNNLTGALIETSASWKPPDVQTAPGHGD